MPNFRQIQLLGFRQFLLQINRFRIFHGRLINRPIVVTPNGVKLCRPSEAVLGLLPNPHLGRFVKGDGEVIDAG